MAEGAITVTLNKGQVLDTPGDEIEALYLIKSGKITAYSSYIRYACEAGHIVGITDCYYGVYAFTYVADEDTVLERYVAASPSDLGKICAAYPKGLGNLVSLHNTYALNLIKNYLMLNMKCRKKDASYSPDTRISKLDLDKYNALSGLKSEIASAFYGANPAIATSALVEISKFTTDLNDACMQMAAFLEIDLDYVPPKEEPKAQEIKQIEYGCDYTDDEIAATLSNSLSKILDYGEIYVEEADEYKALVARFKTITDKLSSDDNTRKIRNAISTGFYKIYYEVLMRSFNDETPPPYITMFLNFGYIDEDLVGMKNAIDLFKLSVNIEDICTTAHVYTMQNWLRAILWGEKEPSKNTLDQSYEEYLKEEFKVGHIKQPIEQLLENDEAKFRYEIDNMFKNAQRMTYGKASSFIAVLIEENMMKSFPEAISSGEAIIDAINRIREVDFSLFYRSTVYTNQEAGVAKEFIYTEVMPDIILTPCIGTMGAMWQEIEGRKRNSPARFMLPIFCGADINQIIMNVLGKFRWELCKRIQGVYWNNIAEKSLTSEYCDYIQFYKKNRDIPDTAKEKIKSTLASCRNNYAEVFTRDYALWINYESKGSGRLNKVSRLILSKYCPFNVNIRTNLHDNPMFTEAIDAYDRKIASEKKKLDNVIKALTAKNINIPKELRETKIYYTK